MTDTPNLGLPYIDGSQAQKHVTHNEALRILDAAIQIGVLDLTLTAPPSTPADGERHVVANGATGAWAGHDNAIATWQDGAWAFLTPKTGWRLWSAADSSLFVFDGAAWQSAGGTAALDNVTHLGVNTTASSPNLLSVTSNAALFAAIDAADGGSGDMRLQVSKESAADTASIFFSDNFSGRAEFGLVGADAFKLKVSPDGSIWTEAFTIDQDSGNLTLPRGLALTGVAFPAQITADQNDYNPAGLAAASVLQINTDAARNVSGLAGGSEGRCLTIINVGSQPVTLLDESASSSASNRFSLVGDLTIAAKQAAILRYDGTAARWQAIAGGTGKLAPRGHLWGLTLSNNASDATNDIDIDAGEAADATGNLMVLASGITKRLDASWSVGTNQGGLDTGTIADVGYHVWLIQRSDTGVVDVLFSTSATAPVMPADYDRKRRIGSIIRASSTIREFVQVGDRFILKTPAVIANAYNLTTTPALFGLAVPHGISVEAEMNVLIYGATSMSVVIQTPLVTSQTANSPAGNVTLFNPAGVSAAQKVSVVTDTSGQIRAVSNVASGANFYIVETGWIDTRGRL